MINPAWPAGRATRHYAEGDLKKAVELLEEAVLLDPDLFNEDVEKIFREAAGQTDRT